MKYEGSDGNGWHNLSCEGSLYTVIRIESSRAHWSSSIPEQEHIGDGYAIWGSRGDGMWFIIHDRSMRRQIILAAWPMVDGP